MVSESVTIKHETLPATVSTAAFQAYRTFYQTQEWDTLMKATLDPTDWGSIQENYYIVPGMKDMDLAPCELPNVIRYNCNVSTKSPGGDKQCSC